MSIGNIKDYTPNYKFIIPRFDKATWHDYIESNFRSIDALFYNIFAINGYSGEWTNATLYEQNKVLFIGDNNGDFTGKLFKVLVEHTTPNTGTFAEFYVNNPTYYEQFADFDAAERAAELAKSWATKLGSTVDGLDYSAKYYAQLAEATVTGKADDNTVVHIEGNETISDVKTFTSSPIVPTVTSGDSSTKVANTEFVTTADNSLQAQINLKANDNAVVHNTGNETIYGSKTFNASLMVSSASIPSYNTKFPDITKGTPPQQNTHYAGMFFGDKNGVTETKDRLGGINLSLDTGGNVRISIVAFKNEANSTAGATLSVTAQPDGVIYASAPASSIKGSIVTTADKDTKYIKLGNGIIIQRGTSTSSSATDTRTITLNKVMPNTDYFACALISDDDISPRSVSIKSKSTNSFTVKLGSSSSGDIDWFVIKFQ